MKLHTLIDERRDTLAGLWVDSVFSTYSEKTTPLLRNNMDPFTNPVGGMVREAAGALLSALAGEETDISEVQASLDRFVKIRAVQQFTPSQSIGVIFLLKPILRREILPLAEKGRALRDYLEMESRIDTLALLAFDMYCRDREKLADIRITEIRNQYAQLRRWAQDLNAEAPLGTFTGCGNQVPPCASPAENQST